MLAVVSVVLALYTLRYMEYAFAVLHATLAVFLFLVHCLNKKVRVCVMSACIGVPLVQPPLRIVLIRLEGWPRILNIGTI